MSWASRRRTTYGFGVILFFLVVVGGPIAYTILSVKPTCTDGKRNQSETDIDKGGPCPLLDERALSPASILWSRSSRVRDGSYNAVAYIQNSNPSAGAISVPYRFRLYDERNIIVAERTGITYIMPGSVTPVFEGAIDTGNRIAAHTYFEFTEPLVWTRLHNTADAIEINDNTIQDVDTVPRVTATARNTSVAPIRNVLFTATVFDPAGNAFAASQTMLTSIGPNEKSNIIFTWPDAFNIRVGRVDIIPLAEPIPFK